MALKWWGCYGLRQFVLGIVHPLGVLAPLTDVELAHGTIVSHARQTRVHTSVGCLSASLSVTSFPAMVVVTGNWHHLLSIISNVLVNCSCCHVPMLCYQVCRKVQFKALTSALDKRILRLFSAQYTIPDLPQFSCL